MVGAIARQTAAVAALMLSLSASSINAQQEICWCAGDCKVRGDPHVKEFDGTDSDLSEPLDEFSSIYSVGSFDVEGYMEAQNSGHYLTKINVGSGFSVDAVSDCSKAGQSIPFDVQIQDGTVPPILAQSVTGKVVCNIPKKVSKCDTKPCAFHLDIYLNKNDTFVPTSNKQVNFEYTEADVLSAQGACVPKTAPWGSKNTQWKCKCSGPTMPPTSPFDQPTRSPTTKPTTAEPTPSPTTKPTTAEPTPSPTQSPTPEMTLTMKPTPSLTLPPSTPAPTSNYGSNLTCNAHSDPWNVNCFNGQQFSESNINQNNLTVLYTMGDEKLVVVGELNQTLVGGNMVTYIATSYIKFNGAWSVFVSSSDCRPLAPETRLAGSDSSDAIEAVQYFRWSTSEEALSITFTCHPDKSLGMDVFLNKKDYSAEAIAQTPLVWEMAQPGYGGDCLMCSYVPYEGSVPRTDSDAAIQQQMVRGGAPWEFNGDPDGTPSPAAAVIPTALLAVLSALAIF